MEEIIKIIKESYQSLKDDNDKAEKPYTDSERLAAYEILLAEIRNILLTPYEQMEDFPQVVIEMIDEGMDK